MAPTRELFPSHFHGDLVTDAGDQPLGTAGCHRQFGHPPDFRIGGLPHVVLFCYHFSEGLPDRYVEGYIAGSMGDPRSAAGSCRGIGRVRIESDWGKGTRVAVDLPPSLPRDTSVMNDRSCE